MMSLSAIKEALDSGDPVVRKWPLVSSYHLPLMLSVLYVLFVTKIGPAFMEKRKPFHLRDLMVFYNFAIVFTYISCLLTIIHSFLTSVDYKYVCLVPTFQPGEEHYRIVKASWILYFLKYVEFGDTVFFILRKKPHLVTQLHLIHHAVLPLFCWLGLRVERNYFQVIPISINAFVHTIMYTYYGLAAMGPEMQKRLWWKKHLTRLQITQFVLIISITLVLGPVVGCSTNPYVMFLVTSLAGLFFILFANFYVKTYNKSSGLNCKDNPRS